MLIHQLTQIQRHLEAQGFDVRPLVFEPGAREQEVKALETVLGLPLPPSFRRALLKHLSVCDKPCYARLVAKSSPPGQ